MTGQKVLQITTKHIKENARKKIYVGQNFILKISNFVLFNFDISDICYIALTKREIKYFHDQNM